MEAILRRILPKFRLRLPKIRPGRAQGFAVFVLIVAGVAVLAGLGPALITAGLLLLADLLT